MNPEKQRLEEARDGIQPWKKWGPYLAERQWGTVREDYSRDGSAWEYFPHDHARSRAYRWGEDGIGGICDHRQRLCLALSLWNEQDPILKERLFGLTGNEGNHGEDVKELYYYLDSSPTHSYMRMLYKYPQSTFPYEELLRQNRNRGRNMPEFELIDTGIFDTDRYFDVFIEYAKESSDDILIRISVHNRAGVSAPIHLLPTLWFRNTWSWNAARSRPTLTGVGDTTIRIEHERLAVRWLRCSGTPSLLFCDNDTNIRRLFGVHDATGYFKDGIDDFIVHGRADAVNSALVGTKAAAHYALIIPAHGAKVIELRLSDRKSVKPFAKFDTVFLQRRAETDLYYQELQCHLDSDDARNVQRQAFAGMLWSKQFYHYSIHAWLHGDPGQPHPPPERVHGRNADWLHLDNADVVSMPDKWEYPWYAAWDLAFHCIPIAMVDADFAKDQLLLLTREWYMHPNGALPAYEWAFKDVNPPVHAWATWRVYKIDKKINGGRGDLVFLERVFLKLLLNFTWWVNRKDEHGENIFEGGFLGLDNIGLFDRSTELPGGGHLEQADATSWMGMYSLNMMRIALELALHEPAYEDLATKFFEHFLYIAGAMMNMGGEGIGLWDDADGFYYDILHTGGDRYFKLKVRSMVGLIPLFAVETLETSLLDRLPEFKRRMEWFLRYRPDLAQLVSRWNQPGTGERRLLSLLRGHRMKMLLRRMLDAAEFLSDYGVRALSCAYGDNPYELDIDGSHFTISYQPGDSETEMFGGNSNWRGPIWFPVNFLLIESLQKFHHYYGDDFRVEYPTGSGTFVTINDVADQLATRLCNIFLRNADGRRPVYGDQKKFQNDPHFRDYILFYEYFHGDTGRGLGASHQTGWTGLVAKLLQPRQRESDAHTAQ